MSEPFPDVVRRSWPPFLALLLLLGMVGWSIWTQNKLVGKIAAMENILSSKIPPEQNELVGRVAAIESILSGKMPPEWEDSLNQLEAQIADSDLWPKDSSEAKRFDGEISDLVTDLPAWADANYLPRLNLIRWAATAFSYLHDHQNPDKLLNDLAMAEDMRSWADAKPASDASDLDRKLREKANQVENRQIDKAIEWAEQYLEKEANTQRDSTEAGPDIASIYEFLGRHEKNNQNKAKIKDLREGLRNEAYRTVEEQQAKAKRKYQEWALEEILKFKKEFQRVSKEVGQASDEAKKHEWSWDSIWASITKTSSTVIAAVTNSWDDKHYEKIQNAMISHLLPIDLALLELPVRKLYDQAFEIGWKTLDGRGEQTGVAKKSAITVKKPLWAVLEDQS